MPGVKLQSPIRDLIPIESSAGPSQDKGKGRAVDEEERDSPVKERAGSLTISEYEFAGAFHQGDACFVYNWIDDEHGDSEPEGPGESLEDWITDRSYHDASEEPIE
jgi:hypothetical protein